ncbi:Alpha/Beta hydrolase protein [Delphinella strobiligena]|nr:Alpha/Beta hydrolase protein [Delphinella strobiligena]
MLASRVFASSRSPFARQCLRNFSSTQPTFKLSLSHDYYEAANPETANAPIVFIHGLFGSKKNNRSMSKVFARDLNRPIYAIDLRNHGESPHNSRHDYTALAEDVEGFISEHNLKNTTLIGHSMGAKTAMVVALRARTKIANLVSVDNAPVDAALKSDFAKYIQGMRKIEDSHVTKQSEADAILAEYEPSLPIRQFLLTNLARDKEDGIQKFRIPVRYLANALDNMADFPFKDPDEARWNGPTLFVRGTKSHYVADEALPIIGRFFPRFEVKDIDCGHWIISERPEEFRQAILEFLQDKE